MNFAVFSANIRHNVGVISNHARDNKASYFSTAICACVILVVIGIGLDMDVVIVVIIMARFRHRERRTSAKYA